MRSKRILVLKGPRKKFQLFGLFAFVWAVLSVTPVLANSGNESEVHFVDNIEVCGRVNASNAQGSSARALLVGINEYSDPKIADLGGAVNDVCLVRRMLIINKGFIDDNILILTDELATRRAIILALEDHLMPNIDKNQVDIFFYFAGHGSQLTDDNGDEIGFDGLDETILPHDAMLSLRNDIRDDTLAPIFKKMSAQSSSVTVMFDSCHSGTALRNTLPPRMVERNEKPLGSNLNEDWQQAFDEGSLIDENITFLSAAAERELANETIVRNRIHGAFTHAFVRSVRSSSLNATARQLVSKTRVYLDRDQIQSQTPTVEGGKADFVFLGDGLGSTNHPYATPKYGQFDFAKFTIPTGDISGETVGSRYELFSDAAGGRVYHATVSKVGPVESELTAESANTPSRIFSARKVLHSYTARAPRVFLEGDLDHVEQYFSNVGMESWLSPLVYFSNYVVSADQTKTELTLRSNRGKVLSVVKSLTDLTLALQYWERWNRFRSIDDNRRGAPLVEASLAGPACKFYSRDFLRRNKMQVCTHEGGEEPSINVRNTDRFPIWLNFIAINPSGSIIQLGAPRQIEPGRTFETPKLGIRSGSGQPETTLLKVFATRNQVDLSAFEQTVLRSDDGQGCLSENLDDLNHVLCIANGTRSDVATVRTGDWSVTDLTITVSPTP